VIAKWLPHEQKIGSPLKLFVVYPFVDIISVYCSRRLFKFNDDVTDQRRLKLVYLLRASFGVLRKHVMKNYCDPEGNLQG
jgi:hypothetical protein